MKKDEAIAYFGSGSKLAKALGISREAVSQWKEIPVPRRYQIEVVTGGALKANPDREAACAA